MLGNSAHDIALQLAPLNEAKLETLAPNYNEADHKRYVEHILHGLADPRNRNIALTGPYGSGKSSILDHVVKKLNGTEPSTPKISPRKVIRISIGTLGPELSDQDATNRIQKELVKQLLYQVKPGSVRHSRFPRATSVPWLRVIGESAGFATFVVSILWMFGIRPDLGLPDTDLPWFAAPLFLGLLTAGAFGIARRYLGARTITQVAAGGASISFDKRTDSVFDKYLDEIIVFFEATRTEIVVFEDLDRFEDPEIFDSLRSLNTLVNESTTMRESGRTLHFVFAIKDSLFEKLDSAPIAGRERKASDECAVVKSGEGESGIVAEGDGAQGEIIRANRTKFFELVVPVVPFLSASNSRDLLEDTFKRLEIAGESVSRRLIDLAARHITDMRLLVNIRNEFVVFSQRLLLADHRAPGITADAMFALVAYKNFHMSDYEQIFRRNSKLDELEQSRRSIVTECVQELQDNRAKLASWSLLLQRQTETAKMLGKRLEAWIGSLSDDLSISNVTVRDQSIIDCYEEIATWRSLHEAKQLNIQCGSPGGRRIRILLDEARLEMLFPEALKADLWSEIDEASLTPERDEIDQKISELRGADFHWLYERSEYRYEGLSFADLTKAKLASELGRELVAAGFLNRYFAEYVSIFYGNFTGVEVANFFRNCVWPNEMDVQFQLSEKDVDNVLEQAPIGFSGSRSALNINLVNRLLVLSQQGTSVGVGLAAPADLLGEIVTFATGPAGAEGLDFLKQFFADPSTERTSLLVWLAELHWDSLLEHVTDPSIVDSECDRIELFNKALQIGADTTFELGTNVIDLIKRHHDQIQAFTETNDDSDRIYPFLRLTGLIVPDLRALSAGLQERIVEDGTYQLTVGNLRTALGLDVDAAPYLDHVARHDAVWRRCVDDLGVYLDVIAEEGVSVALFEPGTLRKLIAEVAQGEESHVEPDMTLLERLLRVSAPESALLDITEVPSWTWSSIVQARRMKPTVDNLVECLEREPSISSELAGFLGSVQEIEGIVRLGSDVAAEQGTAVISKQCRLAVSLLNFNIPDRVRSADFAGQLSSGDDLTGYLEYFDVNSKDLLATLLSAELIADSREVFEHFIRGGWGAVRTAVAISSNFASFLDPELVENVTHELLDDTAVGEVIKCKILDDLDGYASEGPENLFFGAATLNSALTVATSSGYRLPARQLERIAHVGGDHDLLLQQLAGSKELSADELLAVLSKMGGEFKGFSEGSVEPFEIRSRASLTSVLDRLRRGGVVQHEAVQGKKRRRIWYAD